MKLFSRFLSAALLVSLLPVMGACSSQPSQTERTDTSPDTSENATEAATVETVPKPERDTYEDLSFGIPAYEDPGTKSCTVQAEGQGVSGRVLLDFSVLNGDYVISPTRIGFSCHNVAQCDSCGYVAIDGGGAYLMSSEGLDQGGITVTLATPIFASSVQNMTLTFKTTSNAKSSSMRILTADQTNNAAFVNECGSMSGATSDWVTVDLGVKDFAAIADGDGYIRSFQMYFRNKDKTDCYVQSIAFHISPDEFLSVDEVVGNCLYRQGAVEAVASVIASRFEAADIRAEITVTSMSYRKNSSADSGSLRYQATVTLLDGTIIEKQATAVIPAISGMWLDATDGAYGSSHDSLDQWQNTFDPGGLLLLTDNRLSCAEGVARMEYAVVSEDTAINSTDIQWFAPQSFAMNEEGISHLFVNAFLDMNEQLVDGKKYRLLVRGVTTRNNYILHVDIPFTYSPLSDQPIRDLQAAKAAVEQARITCAEDTPDKAAYVLDYLNSIICNEAVSVEVEVLGEGVHSMRLQVTLRSTVSVAEPRLPVYTMNGEVFNDVYNFSGSAFLFEGITVMFTAEQSGITLQSPYDGDPHVILAAACIYDHAKAPLSAVQNVNYGYMKGEHCTPLPVSLLWADENAEEGKTYTVYISEHRDMSRALVFTVNATHLDVYNLNIGTQYYWQVTSGNESSLVQTFITEDGYPRFIKMDGVSNVRDIGGYLTADGKRVRQNLAYRSAQLESVTADGLTVALEQMQIRTDLDLRGGSTRPLGSTVQHISVPMQWYEHIFEEDMFEYVRKTVSTFAYKENYPILFHCSMGRDRTGTTAFLILGLLGVEEDALRHEYYASFFSTQGSFDESEFPLLIINMNRLVAGFDAYGTAEDTLQEKIHTYLIHIGVTEAEIQNIKNILLEQ